MGVRRVVGWAGLVSLPLLAWAFLTGRGAAAAVFLVAGLCLPALTMLLHLGLTRTLSPSEKAIWRRELWIGHRALVAVWQYLLSRDLGEATRSLARERQ